jgi:hypothetical protein
MYNQYKNYIKFTTLQLPTSKSLIKPNTLTKYNINLKHSSEIIVVT